MSFGNLIEVKICEEYLHEKPLKDARGVDVGVVRTPYFKACLANKDPLKQPHKVGLKFYLMKNNAAESFASLDYGTLYAGREGTKELRLGASDGGVWVLAGAEVDDAFVPASEMGLGRLGATFAADPLVLNALTASVEHFPPPAPAGTSVPTPTHPPVWKSPAVQKLGVLLLACAAGLVLCTYRAPEPKVESPVRPEDLVWHNRMLKAADVPQNVVGNAQDSATPAPR